MDVVFCTIKSPSPPGLRRLFLQFGYSFFQIPSTRPTLPLEGGPCKGLLKIFPGLSLESPWQDIFSCQGLFIGTYFS